MIFMLVTLVPCLLVGFGIGAGIGYKLGEQDEKERLKRNSEIYEKR